MLTPDNCWDRKVHVQEGAAQVVFSLGGQIFGQPVGIHQPADYQSVTWSTLW